jgi:nicotinamidase-related amidase
VSPSYLRSPELMDAASSRVVIIDLQTRFAPIIPGFDRIVSGCRRLIQAAQLMSVPVSVTEQYPKGLGETVSELAELVPDRAEKLRFSGAECLDWVASGGSDSRRQILLAGIETHVCLLQTAFDLIAAGFEVYVAADLTGSRNDFDRDIALRRMSDSGVHIVTSEMAMFEWCQIAGTPEFKQLSSIVKGS